MEKSVETLVGHKNKGQLSVLPPTWKRRKKLHELRRVKFFLGFSIKYVKFSAKFGFFNLQIRNYFKMSSSEPVNNAKYVNTMKIAF